MEDAVYFNLVFKKKKKLLKTLDIEEQLQMVETEMEYVSAVVNI